MNYLRIFARRCIGFSEYEVDERAAVSTKPMLCLGMLHRHRAIDDLIQGANNLGLQGAGARLPCKYYHATTCVLANADQQTEQVF